MRRAAGSRWSATPGLPPTAAGRLLCASRPTPKAAGSPTSNCATADGPAARTASAGNPGSSACACSPPPPSSCTPTTAIGSASHPMALERRHHPSDRPAPHPPEPRLTSSFDRPDNPHHHTGEVEPGAHPTRKPGLQPAPAPKRTPPRRHKVPLSKLTGTHERSRLRPLSGRTARRAKGLPRRSAGS
jgi:hypothetical protein